MQLLFVLFLATPLIPACQGQPEGVQPSVGTDPAVDERLSMDDDLVKKEKKTDGNGDASYNEHVEYLKVIDTEDYARVIVEVGESSANYLDLQIEFTALREIKPYTASAEPPRPSVYPRLLVTLPASSYKIGMHIDDDGHFQRMPLRDDLDGQYEVSLKTMNEHDSFRLKFEVLKSALTSGQLNASFNLQFGYGVPFQFKSDKNETPNDASFPLD